MTTSTDLEVKQIIPIHKSHGFDILELDLTYKVISKVNGEVNYRIKPGWIK